MIRKFWWTALVGAAVVGCQSGEDVNNKDFPQNGVAPAKSNPGPGGAGGTSGGYGGQSKDQPGKAGAAQDKASEQDKQGDDKKAPAADQDKADDKAKGEGDAKADDKGKADDKDKAAANVTLSPEQLAAIDKLSDPKDREIALAQKVCLISGKPLGGMGKPFKVTADGKVGFLCCDGCKEEFDKDPKGALAKAGK
jgi:hypothetical protein